MNFPPPLLQSRSSNGADGKGSSVPLLAQRRRVWEAKLRAEARVVRAGKVVGLFECDILDEQERLVARASSTCMTLSGQRARDREVPLK
jgi:acyl-coenzyme A thioesterase PaaI-like protein